MRGILYVRFAEKARPVRAVISSLTGVRGTTRLRSHPNPKASLTAAGRLNKSPSQSSKTLYLFRSGTRGKEHHHRSSTLPQSAKSREVKEGGSMSRGEHPEKSITKTSPFGLVFVFREIIEFKFKRVYLRSFFIETSESDAI